MHLPVWLLVLLAAFATFRLTWLVNHDEIAEPLRRLARAIDRRRLGPPEPDEMQPLTYLVQCPWCVSIYTGTTVSTTAVLWGDNRVIIIGLLALTASALTGLLASALDA